MYVVFNANKQLLACINIIPANRQRLDYVSMLKWALSTKNRSAEAELFMLIGADEESMEHFKHTSV